MRFQNLQRIKLLYRSLALSLLFSSLFQLPSAYSAEADEVSKQLAQLEKRLADVESTLKQKELEIEQLELDIQTEIESSPSIAEVNQLVVIKETSQRASHNFGVPDKSIALFNSDTTLQIGGQIWLDAIYNNGEMTNRAGFQTSSIAYEDNTVNDKTLLSVGQSKLSIKSHTPTAMGDMNTIFEFDMFQSDGDAGFHLTHLWGELGDFGAGQTFSGFMDISAFPNTLEYWGPNSMVFVRQPQIRYTNTASKNNTWMVTIEKSSSSFAYPNTTPSGATPNYHDVNELPDIVANYQNNGDYGYVKTALILRKLGYQTDSASDSTVGWGVNVSGGINLTQNDVIKFQVVHGEGVGRYINDPCCSYYADETGGNDAGLNASGSLTAIPLTGAFAYYDKQWNKKWSSSIGYSYIEVDNLTTQLAKAFHSSSYSTANLIWYPTTLAKVGAELQFGKVESKAGEKADNFRLQTSFGFKY